jgi:hypothetical protein
VLFGLGPEVTTDGAAPISRRVTLAQAEAVRIPDVEMVNPLPVAVHVMPEGRETQVNVPLDVDVP